MASPAKEEKPPPADPIIAGLLMGQGVTDAVAEDLARNFTELRVKAVIEASFQRVHRGRIGKADQPGFIVRALRENYALPENEDRLRPPAERRSAAVGRAKAKKLQDDEEASSLAERERREIEQLQALPAAELADLKAHALERMNDFNRGRLSKVADPLSNPVYRAGMLELLNGRTAVAS